MATPAQISANQNNAQLSTGPRTDEGKAASRGNHLSHGLAGNAFTLLAAEDRSAFTRLVEGLRAEHQPATTTQEILVDRLAQHFWLAQRAIVLQGECLDLASGQIRDEKLFALYLRYQVTHDRAFHACLKALIELRARNSREQIGFESQKRHAAAETRSHEMHHARLRLTNARAASQEIDTEVRTAMDAPLPGHTRIPYDALRDTFKSVICEFNRQTQPAQAPSEQAA